MTDRHPPSVAGFALVLIAVLCVPTSSQTQQVRESVTGNLRIHPLVSEVFANTRQLRIWLPPGYDDPQNADRRYPVLYLTDAQNLFDTTTAFLAREWRVDETADSLIRAGLVEPLIIVGIDHAGRDRIAEFLPYAVDRPEVSETDPRGQRFPEFLRHEVLPFVNATYRTRSGPEHTAIGGSSLGALIALYTVVEDPTLASRLLLESPSLWVASGKVLEQTETANLRLSNVYLGVGTNEPSRERCTPDDPAPPSVSHVHALREILLAKRLTESRLVTVIDECASHNEDAWAGRFPTALAFLFGQDAITPRLPAWMAGCWTLRFANRVTEEHWMPPRGRSMLGLSRTVVDGELRQYEYLRIQASDSATALHALPSGQAPAQFMMTILTDSTVTFANPAHDFPQRIGYTRLGADSMVGWIEGVMDGVSRRGSFPYARQSCESPPSPGRP